MATIATMTHDGDTRTDTPSPPTAPETARAQLQPAQIRAHATADRPLLVYLLTAVTAALIAGIFLLALAGFSTLRNDMRTLHDDMRTLRAEVKTEISVLRTDMNDRFERIGSVLLDHTDRLARIETHLDIRPAAAPASASSGN